MAWCTKGSGSQSTDGQNVMGEKWISVKRARAPCDVTQRVQTKVCPLLRFPVVTSSTVHGLTGTGLS